MSSKRTRLSEITSEEDKNHALQLPDHEWKDLIMEQMESSIEAGMKWIDERTRYTQSPPLFVLISHCVRKSICKAVN